MAAWPGLYLLFTDYKMADKKPVIKIQFLLENCGGGRQIENSVD